MKRLQKYPKVDLDALPDRLVSDLRKGRLNLDEPAVTLELLRLNAVLGITGIFNKGAHQKGGFYHDGRSARLVDVVTMPLLPWAWQTRKRLIW